MNQFGQHTGSIIRRYVEGLCLLATMNAAPLLPLHSMTEYKILALMRDYDYISMLSDGYRVSELKNNSSKPSSLINYKILTF